MDVNVQSKLSKLMCRLDSDNEHETAATIAAINRLFAKVGMDWREIVDRLGWDETNIQWRQMVDSMMDYPNWSEREIAFLENMSLWRGDPSEKQMNWIKSMWDTYQERI